VIDIREISNNSFGKVSFFRCNPRREPLRPVTKLLDVVQTEIKTKFGRQILRLDFHAELDDVVEIVAFAESLRLVIRNSAVEFNVGEDNAQAVLELGWDGDLALFDQISLECSDGENSYEGNIFIERTFTGVVTETPSFQVELFIFLKAEPTVSIESLSWLLETATRGESSHIMEVAQGDPLRQPRTRTETETGPVMASDSIFLPIDEVFTVQIEEIKIGFLAADNFKFGPGAARFVECSLEENGELDFLGVEIGSVPEFPKRHFFNETFYIEGNSEKTAQGIQVQALITEATKEVLKVDYVIIWEREETNVEPE